MLIVIVIIGILAWALIPRIWNARDKAQDVAIQANANALVSAAMQAIMDGWTPCSGDNVQYDEMSTYGMTTLEQPFHCRRVAGDHVVVWTTGMHVTANNNCQVATLTGFTANTDLNTVIAAVGAANGLTVASGGVYCLAQ